MSQQQAIEDYTAPLPVGCLARSTIVEITLAERIHHRAGPWAAIEGEDSRLLRVGDLEELLFTSEWAPLNGTPRTNSHLEAVDRQRQEACEEDAVHAVADELSDRTSSN